MPVDSHRITKSFALRDVVSRVGVYYIHALVHRRSISPITLFISLYIYIYITNGKKWMEGALGKTGLVRVLTIGVTSSTGILLAELFDSR